MIILTTSIVALAAWPSVASADVSLSDGKFGGGTTGNSSPPGGVLPASVKGTVSGATWSSTRWKIGSSTACYDHNTWTSGDHAIDFRSNNKNTVTAPGGPNNSYPVVYTPYASNDCSGNPSGSAYTLTNALNVTGPGENHNLVERCGINVMLVLDESGSIASSNATGAVRTATKSFLVALSGTGSEVSIVDFSSTAGRPIPYTVVTPESITGTFNPYIDNTNGNGYNPNGWTNWEAAFQKVDEANGSKKADLVVFMTDGDPTAMNKNGGGVTEGLTEGDVEALQRAQFESNDVKSDGSHVFMLGVGAAVAVDNPESADRLTAVSGFEKYPPNPFGRADFTLVKEFAGLAAALRQIVSELCGNSVTITKQVDEGDGVFKPDPGWKFTGDVSMNEGSYTWVLPKPPPDTGPREETTNEQGVATFQWDLSRPTAPSARATFSFSEEVNAGYAFVDAECTVSQTTRKRRRVLRRFSLSTPSGEVELAPGQDASCLVRNRIIPGTIEIEKNATPESSQEFRFHGLPRHRELHARRQQNGRERLRDIPQPPARDLHGQRAGSRRLGAHGTYLHSCGGRHDYRASGDDHARPRRLRGMHVQRQENPTGHNPNPEGSGPAERSCLPLLGIARPARGLHAGGQRGGRAAGVVTHLHRPSAGDLHDQRDGSRRLGAHGHCLQL